jgi:hypothetical protein
MKQLEKNGYKNTILDGIWAKQLVWYEHLQIMDEDRLPQKISNQTPAGRKKRDQKQDGKKAFSEL